MAIQGGEKPVLLVPVTLSRPGSVSWKFSVFDVQRVAIPELDFAISATSHKISVVEVKAKNITDVSLDDGFDRFTSGEAPDHDIAVSVSSDNHIVGRGGIELYGYDTSSMSTKGRVQRTLSSKIPNPSSPVGRSRHQVVALKRHCINHMRVAILRVVWMRQLKRSVSIEVPMCAGL